MLPILVLRISGNHKKRRFFRCFARDLWTPLITLKRLMWHLLCMIFLGAGEKVARCVESFL
jgi:hypothetical protein